jgi:hypothetical protein
MKASTLRPGLLVSLKTSISGNVQYRKTDLERDHITDTGAREARWETQRIVYDPEEHERAVKVRGQCRWAVGSVCSTSEFGYLCPEQNEDKLDAAIAEAQRLADEFNDGAKLTHISVYVMKGRVEQDDVQAIRAINAEVRDLLTEMSDGIERMDPKKVREAANKAKNLGQMLSPEASAKIQDAIEAARSAARMIVKAGEEASVEIDEVVFEKINAAQTAFLDLDEQGEIVEVEADALALDLPTEPVTQFEPVGITPEPGPDEDEDEPVADEAPVAAPAIDLD